ncbi:MAG: hypothetical protein EBR60_06320, partial [Burkholderiaceae bacterium]|nr:hypothetical protein [Burkholderiaceae bacterium]
EKDKASNISLIQLSLGLAWVFGAPIGSFLSNSHVVSWFNNSTPFFALFFALLILLFFIVFAKLSDRIGRKKVMLTGMALAVCCYFPIYKQMSVLADWKSWENNPEYYHVQTTTNVNEKSGLVEVINRTSYLNGCKRVEIISLETGKKQKHPVIMKQKIYLNFSKLSYLGFLIFLQLIFVCMVYGPIAAFLVELFPPEIRYTSLSLPYHIGNGIFGGLTPLIAELLVLKFNDPLAGIWYPVFIGVLTLIVGLIFIAVTGILLLALVRYTRRKEEMANAEEVPQRAAAILADLDLNLEPSATAEIPAAESLRVKLNLAKAYITIEDFAAARKAIEEILLVSNQVDPQMTISAKSLLSEINQRSDS